MNKIRGFVLALGCLFLLGTIPAYATTLDFEDLPDLTSVGEFYSSYGVHFNGAISLTAGFSLNEIDYPPSSGLIAIGDDFGPIQITFDNPTQDIFANFTFGSQLTLSAYDGSGNLIGTYINPLSSNFSDSELITLNYTNVSSLIISGQMLNSFILDDLNYTSLAPVPEPSTLFLLGGGLVGLLRHNRKKTILC